MTDQSQVSIDHLTPEQRHITQEKGTETPFTGKYYKHDGTGDYHCIVCGNKLFSSDTKYESGSGWPSFYQAIDQAAITLHEDTSHGMVRTEVTCANCGAHLGHLFDDGPQPTGERFCINSCALDFKSPQPPTAPEPE